MPDLTLVRQMRRLDRRREARALALTVPAVLFLLVALILPLLSFMGRAADNSELNKLMPRTIPALALWQGEGYAPEPVREALIGDLLALRGTPSLAIVARRLNYHEAGYRSLIQKTATTLSPESAKTAAEQLAEIDPRWEAPDIWSVLKQESGRFTPFFLLSALDLKRDAQGHVVQVPAERAIYQKVFVRTFVASIAVTAICLVLGYVAAYALVRLPSRLGKIAIFIVLISVWTSLLVRTLAWIVILQKNGVLNAALTGAGIVDEPLQFIRTWFAVIVAMVHLLLPLMILPIASVMQAISPSYVRAARSLGASPIRAFWTVYLPQTLPGVGAGAVLVATLALGFFITPELLGGPEQQMISYFVAFFTNMSVNWGLASALGAWLFVMTIALVACTYGMFNIMRGRR